MNSEDKLQGYLAKYPQQHKTFFARPHWTRRQLFEVATAGIMGAFIPSRALASEVVAQAEVTPINKARNVVFILLSGAPSHIDTFDYKEVAGVTPVDFAPETIGGIRWPVGLLPKIGQQLGDIAIIRSMRAWALVHNLAQVWTQIGRNPAAVLGDIAPNIGSIVSIEKAAERTLNQVFPTFLALNSPQGIGSGYLPTTYAPFKTIPNTAGLANTTNPDGAVRLDERWSLLHMIDDMRVRSPLGRSVDDMEAFYQAAKGMVYNPAVDQAFRFTPADAARYGSTTFGSACLVAKQVLAANQGTRFVQISMGGWDMHQDIYDRQDNPNGNIYALGKQLDDGVSAMLADLKSSGLLNDTLVVMCGEFGRTVGQLSAQAGRDHFLQHFCMFAGAGVKGGRTIGSTNAAGAQAQEFGWSRDRYIRAEDIEATIYSAMGINWTNVRYDDPFGRGFEYVPGSKDDLYGPVNELWA